MAAQQDSVRQYQLDTAIALAKNAIELDNQVCNRSFLRVRELVCEDIFSPVSLRLVFAASNPNLKPEPER